MNLNELKDNNYLIFFMLNDDYVNNQYSNINIIFYIFKKASRYICRVVFHFIIFFKYFPKNLFNEKKIIFFSISKNNYDSLLPVQEIFKNSSISLSPNFRLGRKSIIIPLIIPLMVSLFFIPKLVVLYLKCNHQNRRRIILYIDVILLSMGYNIFIKYYLKLLKPKKIVYANDHGHFSRILVKRAESIGIPCFYIQHAAVTNIFPKIISSYALLEGKDSLNKYSPNRYQMKNVYLIGSPKFDKFINHVNTNKKVESIGICSTGSMDKIQIAKLIEAIKDNYGHFKIIFRPHPKEEIQKKYKGIIKSNSIIYSNSTIEDSYHYLRNVDIVISGNSSILLEAAVMNVYPINWIDPNSVSKFKDNPIDKYGFNKSKLVRQCHTIEEIIGLIELIKFEKPNVRSLAKYYIDTIGTKSEGNSSLLAANIIRNNY